MEHERTPMMTTIGVMSIGFGALFSVMCLFLLLRGGGTVAEAMGAGGGFMKTVGFAASALNVLLIATGVGVLKVAPWGRRLSIVYGAAAVVIYLIWFFSSGFGVLPAVAMIYTVVLVATCLSPGWRAAFGSAGAGDVKPVASGETRAAA